MDPRGAQEIPQGTKIEIWCPRAESGSKPQESPRAPKSRSGAQGPKMVPRGPQESPRGPKSRSGAQRPEMIPRGPQESPLSHSRADLQIVFCRGTLPAALLPARDRDVVSSQAKKKCRKYSTGYQICKIKIRCFSRIGTALRREHHFVKNKLATKIKKCRKYSTGYQICKIKIRCFSRMCTALRREHHFIKNSPSRTTDLRRRLLK